MFGNGFSREAIVYAHKLAAILDGKREPKMSAEADRLADVCGGYEDDKYVALNNATSGEDVEWIVCFFCLLAKRDEWDLSDWNEVEWGHGSYDREVEAGGAIGLAHDLSRIVDPHGVEIKVETSSDDPTMLTYNISDRIANAWAEHHGALAGGTWECPDGDHSFVYDTGFYWDVEEMTDGDSEAWEYNFDLSEYEKPDDTQLAIAEHASGCDVCCHDYSAAAKHWDDPLQHAADHAVRAAEQAEWRAQAKKNMGLEVNRA